MSNPLTIAIACEDSARQAYAETLAHQLQLPIVATEATTADLLLMVTSSHLELRQLAKAAPGPIWVDFLSSKNSFRRLPQNLKTELIARAVQVKSVPQLKIIDATAGFGQDAFILASLGHQLQLIERCPIIATLLQDGINRLKVVEPQLNLTLSEYNALDYLQTLSADAYPDVIYLDPMFPERTKSALVKKEMRLLHQLIGQDSDAPALLTLARTIARYKVVVKRPRLAPYLGEQQPSYSLSGKVGRFDVYSK